MKKSVVILISVALVIAFAALVYYGLMRARGMPVRIEKEERVHLKAPFINKDIDLSKGISLDLWDTLEAREIELLYQVMILPWGKSLISPINVKAFHNKGFIYFYIEWNDETENRIIGQDRFTDATAVLFPMDEKVQLPTLMMGFIGKANIWQWKASQDLEFWVGIEEKKEVYSDFYYPFEEEELFPVSKEEIASAANDLMAVKVGTITPKEIQNIEGRGFWEDGIWRVILKRRFEAARPQLDAIFKRGEKRLCAFAVWNGEKGDRGGRKSISDWVELEIE